jgi:hypothetical protein
MLIVFALILLFIKHNREKLDVDNIEDHLLGSWESEEALGVGDNKYYLIFMGNQKCIYTNFKDEKNKDIEFLSLNYLTIGDGTVDFEYVDENTIIVNSNKYVRIDNDIVSDIVEENSTVDKPILEITYDNINEIIKDNYNHLLYEYIRIDDIYVNIGPIGKGLHPYFLNSDGDIDNTLNFSEDDQEEIINNNYEKIDAICLFNVGRMSCILANQ